MFLRTCPPSQRFLTLKTRFWHCTSSRMTRFESKISKEDGTYWTILRYENGNFFHTVGNLFIQMDLNMCLFFLNIFGCNIYYKDFTFWVIMFNYTYCSSNESFPIKDETCRDFWCHKNWSCLSSSSTKF